MGVQGGLRVSSLAFRLFWEHGAGVWEAPWELASPASPVDTDADSWGPHLLKETGGHPLTHTHFSWSFFG